MANYTPTVDFSDKDDLAAGSGGEKIISGVDWDDELAAIQTAIATKYESDDLASQAEAEAGSLNTVLMTALRTQQHGANKFLTPEGELLRLNWSYTILGADVDWDSNSPYTLVDDAAVLADSWYEWEMVLAVNSGGFAGTTTCYLDFASAPKWQYAMGRGTNGSGLSFGTALGSGSAVLFPNNAGLSSGKVRGLLNTNVATTFDVILTEGATNATLRAGSYFRIRRIGADS